MIDVTKDYGVVGDGITDDTATLQAALQAESWIYLPGGTYRLEGMLRTPARRRITVAPDGRLVRAGDDPIITNTPAGGGAGGYGGHGGHGGLLLEGGVWDVNGVRRPAYSGAFVFAHARDVTVRDLTVLDVPGWHAVECNSSSGVRVQDCRFAGFRHTGDRGFSEAVQIDAAYGAVAYPWGGPYDGTMAEDVSVVGCWFGASGTPGTQAWPRAVGSHATAAGQRYQGISIEQNRCYDLADAAFQSFHWDGVLIAHNRIHRPRGEGIAIKDDSRYVNVRDNQIYDAGRSGLWVNTDCTQVSLRGNEVIGASASEHNTHFGIRASSNCSYLRITGNTVRKRASGNHARYGLSITDTCSHVQRHGNDLRSSGATGSLSDTSPSPITAATDAL